MPSNETALNKVLAILPDVTYRKMMGVLRKTLDMLLSYGFISSIVEMTFIQPDWLTTD